MSGDEVAIDDVTSEHGVIAVNGPRSRDILAPICDVALGINDGK